MRACRLDRKISIERKTDTRDDHGQPIPNWERIGKTRWASRSPVSGTERFNADQFIAREQVEFSVQWASDLADLSAIDRVVYPPTSDTPSDSSIYDVIAVHEIAQREGLRIITARRSEV